MKINHRTRRKICDKNNILCNNCIIRSKHQQTIQIYNDYEPYFVFSLSGKPNRNRKSVKNSFVST